MIPTTTRKQRAQKVRELRVAVLLAKAALADFLNDPNATGMCRAVGRARALMQETQSERYGVRWSAGREKVGRDYKTIYRAATWVRIRLRRYKPKPELDALFQGYFWPFGVGDSQGVFKAKRVKVLKAVIASLIKSRDKAIGEVAKL